MTQAPTPGPLSVGDYAVRLEDHPLVKAGEVHRVTEMFRGGYLGFARPVGGEWNPSGWRKCDADGWVPWSGGPNPVPGQRVEAESEACAYHGLSDEFDWIRGGHYKIHRFRVAPTAPVEASGSEREDMADIIKALRSTLARPQTEFVRIDRTDAQRILDALTHPPPSGETREQQVAAVMTALNSFHVLSGRVTSTQAEHVLASLDALSARPLALGGQHGGGEGFDELKPNDIAAIIEENADADADGLHNASQLAEAIYRRVAATNSKGSNS